MNRTAARLIAAGAIAAAALGSATAAASAATVPAPTTAGIGAALWGPSTRITVAPGTTRTIYLAFYSTGPAETATVTTTLANPAGPSAAFARAAAAGYLSVATKTITLPAKPAAPITLTHIPNGAGGYENLTTPNAYVFVPVTITVPAAAPAYTYTTGDAYETITAQVQTAPAAGITTSPGAGIAIALSTR